MSKAQGRQAAEPGTATFCSWGGSVVNFSLEELDGMGGCARRYLKFENLNKTMRGGPPLSKRRTMIWGIRASVTARVIGGRAGEFGVDRLRRGKGLRVSLVLSSQFQRDHHTHSIRTSGLTLSSREAFLVNG